MVLYVAVLSHCLILSNVCIYLSQIAGRHDSVEPRDQNHLPVLRWSCGIERGAFDAQVSVKGFLTVEP